MLNTLNYAPYSSSLYKALLASLTSNNSINVCSFNATVSADTNKVNVFFRHDIDTELCLLNLQDMICIDKSFGVKPGIFFLVSDQTYDIRSCEAVAVELKSNGYAVGLHTVCYLEDDYLAEFQREIDKFTNTFGFKPDTFNAHGLGSIKQDNRLKFYDEMAIRYKDFGFEYSDCCAKLRQYQHVIEDCHLDRDKNNRYIKTDFAFADHFMQKGNNLVLTHPCYWVF